MRAIVLAGGQGVRLQPYTSVLPKPLIPLDDMPILQIILLQLRQAGVTQVTLAVYYHAQQIIRYFGGGHWLDLNIEYSVTTDLLGTAGPLASIDSFTEPTLVLNADILTTVDFADVYATHQRGNTIATVVIQQHEVAVPYGVVETDPVGSICTIVEKPKYTYMINTGVYVLDPGIRRYIPAGSYQDMSDLLRYVIAQGHTVNSYVFDGEWMDLGTPEQFRLAREKFRQQRERYISSFPALAGQAEHGVEVSRLGLGVGPEPSVDFPKPISLWR